MDEQQRTEREKRHQQEQEELRQRRENMQRRSDSQAAAGFDVIRTGDDSASNEGARADDSESTT